MGDIKFSKEEIDIITRRIQLYFREELQQELGQFDAQFLFDFFTEEIGPYFYNRGLYDAQAIVEQRVEEIAESVFDLEKTTNFKR